MTRGEESVMFGSSDEPPLCPRQGTRVFSSLWFALPCSPPPACSSPATFRPCSEHSQQRKLPGQQLMGCRAASTHATDAVGAKQTLYPEQLSLDFRLCLLLESNLAMTQPISRPFPVKPGSQQPRELIPKSNCFYHSLSCREDAAGPPPGSVMPSLDPKSLS